MKVGMLWLDGSEKAHLGERIRGAAEYYRNKYAEQPNVCFVHPSTEAGDIPARVGSLAVKQNLSVIPGHFWIGVQKSQDKD